MFKVKAISGVLLALRPYYGSSLVFSLALNLLYLAGSVYMLQVYDRVVSSGSVTTLLMLSLILVVAYLALAGLDMVRGRILNRAGARIDALLSRRLFEMSLERPEIQSQALRDLDILRGFASGAGVQALLDLPWIPIYLGVLFLLHPALGWFALGGMVVVTLLAVLNELLLRTNLSEATQIANQSYAFVDVTLRNADAVRGMGMTEGLLRRWSADRRRMLEAQVTAGERGGLLSAAIKFCRLALQSLVLGLGAYLVIERMATAGVMFAGSMLLGRAYQPVEQVVGNWRGFVAARDALKRLSSLLANARDDAESLQLPEPTGKIAVEGLVYALPGSPKPILRGVSFGLEAGEILGVIGPSSAGKSTLARLLMGVVSPSGGAVRLDGADLSRWPKNAVGRHLGYLPQEVDLFPATVAANISRFTDGADAAIVEAARLAGVHDLILQLPQGYDTPIGVGGVRLSGGYRQRIGLARAVFGNPKLVVLDEPSSNLDTLGDQALAECLLRLKERRTTVIIISHRAGTLGFVDRMLMLRDGQVEAFGPRDDILRALAAQRQAAASPGPNVVPVNAQMLNNGASR